MSAEGVYITRTGAGLQLERHRHGDDSWLMLAFAAPERNPAGVPVQRFADMDSLCEAARLGLTHTPDPLRDLKDQIVVAAGAFAAAWRLWPEGGPVAAMERRDELFQVLDCYRAAQEEGGKE